MKTKRIITALVLCASCAIPSTVFAETLWVDGKLVTTKTVVSTQAEVAGSLATAAGGTALAVGLGVLVLGGLIASSSGT